MFSSAAQKDASVEHDGEAEPHDKRVSPPRSPRSSAGARSRSALACVGHGQTSVGSEIDDREHADPHDIERMPEQAEAVRSANHHPTEAERRDLRHHHEQPQQS